MLFNQNKENNVFFEELHLRHLSLLIDLKNIKINNWFYKMVIINTLDDLKIFLSNLDKNKNKCIIAIQNRRIIGYLYTYTLNYKKTCVKINAPKFILEECKPSKRYLIYELIKKSISSADLKNSNWIINSNISDDDLISASRELGFQPLQEIKIWSKNNFKDNDLTHIEVDDLINNFVEINKNNIKRSLNFIRSNESILFRNLLDLDHSDIYKRNDKNSGLILFENEIIFMILKDLNYQDSNVYSLIRGFCWDERLNLILKYVINTISKKNPYALFKTYSDDNDLNEYLLNLNMKEQNNELLLVRNSLIRRDVKSENMLNKSIEKIFHKINPQNNPFPTPYPINLKPK